MRAYIPIDPLGLFGKPLEKTIAIAHFSFRLGQRLALLGSKYLGQLFNIGLA